MVLEKIYFEFIDKFKLAVDFIQKNFGEKDILMNKVSEIFPSRNQEVKNSLIKGYVFHGTGCNFRFKKCSIDVEFFKNEIGFTNWSFYIFANSINNLLTIRETDSFLKNKVLKSELKNFEEDFYYHPSSAKSD
ncbi:hypothetical protein EH230_08115 [Flavobacterium columnare]|uniref:DUF6896 domain-containing protein n=1 Tax=Flavobacterium columnare TaxID=996 RepID=A0A437UB68_9FLAO|nr:hypothetical protein [Flavobacterium columnare]RVU90849.1 hypothetical protein EH230_08010 [Flavobacterium columnare]RVU90863.1 hypothetical protein EH230_08080 [Flavobacterium columnare]RVU90870.1 hypothetical protein EH230_08115 [Flavobacterium columnare]